VVQSFDDRPLRELAREFPSIPRTLLIDARGGLRWLTRDGLGEIARFATGIGPSKALIDGRAEVVALAKSVGLTVTPYTFTTRGSTTRFGTVTDEMRYYLMGLKVDAVFADNPDLFPRRSRR